VVGRLGVEEGTPVITAAGHQFFTPTYTGLGERAHLASPSNDLETHVNDVLGVLKFEDLRDGVLIGHSYGSMVAGVRGINEARADDANHIRLGLSLLPAQPDGLDATDTRKFAGAAAREMQYR
jgi:hypothetical protein